MTWSKLGCIMSLADFEERKESLIELIEWYRDDYHGRDFIHSEMIENIRKIETLKELELQEKIVDGWLDY